jgi:hypothetical protein
MSEFLGGDCVSFRPKMGEDIAFLSSSCDLK